MDEAKLQEIDERRAQVLRDGTAAGALRMAADDVPELVAEVRRLTAALDAVTAEHADALDAARREGAEDMRDHAAEACDAFAEDSQRELEEHGDGDYGTAQWIQGRESGANVCADQIRALPLDAPGGGS